MLALALLAGEQPLLAEDLAVAHHRHRAVEARPAHHAAPEELAVLRALGLRLEGDRVAGSARRVRAVAVLPAVAGRRAKAAILEDDRVGVALGLAALQHHTDEIAAIQHV